MVPRITRPSTCSCSLELGGLNVTSFINMFKYIQKKGLPFYEGGLFSCKLCQKGHRTNQGLLSHLRSNEHIKNTEKAAKVQATAGFTFKRSDSNQSIKSASSLASSADSSKAGVNKYKIHEFQF